MVKLLSFFNLSYILANCEPGTFVNMTTATCQRCSSVEYQDESGQRACKICPNNFHNNGINMSDVSHCKAGNDGTLNLYPHFYTRGIQKFLCSYFCLASLFGSINRV